MSKMATFHSASQARSALKMTLSNYAWYGGSSVESEKGDYCIVVYLEHIDNEIRKVIPTVFNEVSVKMDISPKNKKQRQGY